MRIYLAIFFLISFFISAWSKPIPQVKRAIIIDTDCAIDDMRALSLLLTNPSINIVGIIASEGSLSPKAGASRINALLKYFNSDTISVLCGKESKGVKPPWRTFNENIDWGKITDKKCMDAELWLKEYLKSNSQKADILCLGALTAEADILKENPELKSKINRIIWYNDNADPLQGFNYDCDKAAVDFLFKLDVRIDVISNFQKDFIIFDNAFFMICKQAETPVASLFYKVHSQDEVYKRMNENHFKLNDELAAIYLMNADLFDVYPLSAKRHIRCNNDFDRMAVKEVITDILQGHYSLKPSIVLNSFPIKKDAYTYDVRQIMDSALSRYGYDEWKSCVLTDEFHGHLGVYSIVGSKMGILAREYFGVGPDMLEVISYAGIRPPYSCLNDGIQVSTGATLGQGTISLAKDSIPSPKAIFRYNDKSIMIELKKEYISKVDADIKDGILKFGLMDDGYWKLVRHAALKYWLEWDRKEIFEIREVK